MDHDHEVVKHILEWEPTVYDDEEQRKGKKALDIFF